MKMNIRSVFVICFFVAISFFSNTSKVSAIALSNSGGGNWPYSREFDIKGSASGGVGNYQFRLDINTLLLGNPYTNIKADGSDIRFTNSVGTELPYWIEEGS